jgi:hypothetical protein
LNEASQISPIPTHSKILQHVKIQKLHLDEESADVVFEVGGHQEHDDAKEDNTIKKRKTEVTKFHAHSFILKNAAPLLVELCSFDDPSPTILIPIVSPETFRHLLLYIYGHDIPDFGADISHWWIDMVRSISKSRPKHMMCLQ